MKSSSRQNWLLVSAVIVLAVIPLVFVRGAEFSGSDAQAEGAIQELHPSYEPWFKPLFEPARGEVEGLLFSSQAALGAGVIGYVIGRYKARSELQRHRDDPSD